MMDKSKLEDIVRNIQSRLGSDYSVSNISGEEYRIVTLSSGIQVRIDKPLLLITRNGGSTHRVITEDKRTFCYADPSSGKTMLEWKEKNLISF